MKVLILIIVGCISCLKVSGSFATDGEKNGLHDLSSIVIRLDDKMVDKKTFEWLYKTWVPKQSLTKKDFANQVVENWILYQYTTLQSPQKLKLSDVDYKLDWYLERQLSDYCEANFPLSSQLTMQQKVLDALDEKALKLLASNFQLKSTIGFELTEEQTKRLSEINVFSLIEGTPLNSNFQFSLLNLFERLSIQDKQRLFDGDYRLIKREVGIKLSFEQGCKQLENNELNTLRNLLASLYFRTQLLDLYAVSLDQHGNNNSIEAFKQKVTNADIKQYYQANKDSFKYLQAARYKLASFEKIDDAKSYLRQFSKEEVSRTSSWYDKSNNWKNNLAFSLPLNQLSSPIRTPNGKWVVVYVFEHRYQYHKLETETVKYQATRELAIEYAKSFYQQLITDLKHKHKVVVNV